MSAYYHELLNILGLTSNQFLLIMVGASVLINIILFFWNIGQQVGIKKLKRQYAHLMRGNKDVDLEHLILTKFEDVESMQNVMEKHEGMMEQLREDMKTGFSKSGLVRYDAFDAMAGNLSFALALLDKNNDGFLLNVLYGREGCYTYIKEINNGESEIELSNEERDAVDLAVNQEEE